jgi:hypothetical protein
MQQFLRLLPWKPIHTLVDCLPWCLWFDFKELKVRKQNDAGGGK